MRATLTTAAAALTAVALAACSSATAGTGRLGGPHPQSPAPTATHRPGSSGAPAPYPYSAHSSALPAAPAGSSAGQPDVEQALLAASDLGRGFAAAAPDRPSALPCTPDRPPVDEQIRHVEKGNAVFVDDVAATQVSEQVYVYATPASAVRHQRLLDAGLSCRHGAVQGHPVTVLGPSDVRRQLRLHTDAAQVWVVHSGRITAALVALRIRAVVAQFAVVTENGTTSDVDVKKVVVAGLTKLYAVARG